MGVHEGRANLNKGLKNLLMQWAEAKSQWEDVQSKKFEQKYIDPLQQDLKIATSAMDQMAVLLAQARHDCTE
jgi:hypothetical protein